jgi:putative hydrolase of the HAD superfamily
MDPPAFHLREELARRGLEVEPAVAAAAFRAEIAYYLEHHVEGHDRASLDDLRDRCARVMSEALGNPPVDVRGAMLAALRFVPFPDAPGALRRLRAEGLGLVVASNWDCSLGEVLREARLRELVDGVVTSAEAGAAKPDRRLFDAALERVRCPTERALYVGDSPAADVGGARAAGLHAVLLRRHGERPDRVPADSAPGPTPDAVIASLAELPSLLFDR